MLLQRFFFKCKPLPTPWEDCDILLFFVFKRPKIPFSLRAFLFFRGTLGASAIKSAILYKKSRSKNTNFTSKNALHTNPTPSPPPNLYSILTLVKKKQLLERARKKNHQWFIDVFRWEKFIKITPSHWEWGIVRKIGGHF